MRMWNINPGLMCKQHLLGEHFEIHKALGNLKHTGKWAKSLTKKGFLEPQNFVKRHDKLVNEMKKRNINHNSKIDADKVKQINLPIGKVDTKKSVRDLKKRCKRCRDLINQEQKNKEITTPQPVLKIPYGILGTSTFAS